MSAIEFKFVPEFVLQASANVPMLSSKEKYLELWSFYSDELRYNRCPPIADSTMKFQQD
jgi:hypothetical protein